MENKKARESPRPPLFSERVVHQLVYSTVPLQQRSQFLRGPVMEDLSIYHDTDLLLNQENMSKYRPGGFHLVCLGDIFKDGRYKVHHELGWGGYSTVWLALDQEYITARRKLYSVSY